MGTAAAGGHHSLTVDQIASMIDHSLLRPDLTPADVLDGCSTAVDHRVATVCCRPADVALVTKRLRDSDVRIGTVVGFPHGSSATAVKVNEAERALGDGATELDMVINIGRLRGGYIDDVVDDIGAVVAAAKRGGAVTKVILENAYLTRSQITTACRLTEQAGAEFVKTSTGFASTGATLKDVRLMRASVGPATRIKAAGGIRTLDLLLAMAAEGVTRFGATATMSILADAAVRCDDGHLMIPSRSDLD